MRYKPQWKGRLRLSPGRHVWWDGKLLGQINHRTTGEDAPVKTPGGMLTHTLFFVVGKPETEYTTMTLAIASLLPEDVR